MCPPRRFTIELPAPSPSFETDGSIPLLAAARAAGVPMVSSCRNGTCRACIAKLSTGTVTYRIEWPGLSADEKATGYCLPCVAYPDSDIVVQRFGAD